MDTNYIYSQHSIAEQNGLIKFQRYIRKIKLNLIIMLLSVIILIMVYTIVGQLIQINVKMITTQETLAKSAALEKELIATQIEINQAKSYDVVSYKASQEYGMIKRNEKQAVVLMSQNHFTSALVYEEPLTSYESFNFVEAVKSILK